MKGYFDQNALLYPIEEIIQRVEQRDYGFFLDNRNFLKVVDTLEKFEKQVINLDSQQGRDFIVFKRQLYQIYEIQNRSQEEHEAFSFHIERQNLKWLWNSNLDFLRELDRQNALIDKYAHANLKGKIFKRKSMDPYKLKGLGYFGVSALAYSKYSILALHFGQTLPMLGVIGTALAGMTNFNESSKINSIEWIKEGEHQGKLKFNVSTGPFTSKDLIVAT